MRHQKKRFKLGRTAAHRRATLAAMACALIEHKKIETTLVKAKALRTYIEPIITRAKDDTTHNRREIFRHLHRKEAIKELFGVIAPKVGDRPGGYTRVLRLGLRHGDAAEMAIIELVDWNDVKPDGAASTRKKTRRGRRGATADAAPAAAKAAASSVTAADEDVVIAEEAVAEVESAVEEVEAVVEVEETVVEEEVEAVAEVAEAEVEAVAEEEVEAVVEEETAAEVEAVAEASDEQPAAEAETEEDDSEEKES